MQEERAGPGPHFRYNQEKETYDDQVHNSLQLDRHSLLLSKFFFRLR
jgi:hypothetical protein